MYFRIAVIALLMLSINSYSAEYFSGHTKKVAFGDTLDQDLFAGCQNVDVFGYAAGDIYAGCETVTIDGKVQDDVLVACRNFKLTGIINDGLIVFAEVITIDGTVRGDVLAFGRQVRLTRDARLEGNLFVGCGELLQEGAPVAGFIKGGTGYAMLDGRVGGTVELEVDKVEFGSDYSADGGTILTVPDGFDENKLEVFPADLELIFEEAEYFFQTPFFYWAFFSFLITGVLIILVFRNSSKDYITYVRSNAPLSLLAGLVTMIVVPTALTIISLFVITIPVAAIAMVLYLILAYLSFIFSALYVGDYIWKMVTKTNGRKVMFWPLITGLIVICLVIQIPYLGGLLAITFVCFGMGSLIMYIWKTKRMVNETAQ